MQPVAIITLVYSFYSYKCWHRSIPMNKDRVEVQYVFIFNIFNYLMQKNSDNHYAYKVPLKMHSHLEYYFLLFLIIIEFIILSQVLLL